MTTAISKALELKGQQCTISNDGKEGLKMILEQKFDKILLDLYMPKFSGFDVLDSLEKDRNLKELKIIVFTATPDSDPMIKELRNKGVFAFLKKPVKLADLLKEVEA